MDIYVDLNSKAISFGAIGATEPQLVKIRQTEDIRLKWHRDSVVEEITGTDAIFVGLKSAKDSTTTLASTTAWAHTSGVANFYTASLDLNTTAINDIFDADDAADELAVYLEITRTPSGGSVRRYDDPAQALKLVRSVFTGDEGSPTSVSTLWYPPHLINVTGLTGGGLTNLDGALSPTIADIGKTYTLYIAANSTPYQTWRLKAGTDAEDAPNGIVRPDNYNGTTNAVVWIQIA